MTTSEIKLIIEGMTCPMCAEHVQKALESVPGVQAATVPGWESGRATVTSISEVAVSELIQAVTMAGYRARPAVKRKTPPKTVVPSDTARDYDLIVIGTGGGGMAAAIKAAETGHQVAIIEAGTLGGTCVNIGCVPSKTLIRAAEQRHRALHSPFAGVETHAAVVDWAKVRAQKDALVKELRQSKYSDVLAAYADHLTLVRGWARLTAASKVAVGNKVLSARGIIIATGARPTILPIPGIDKVDVLDSTSAMALDELPASLLVLGGRAVALELGQMFMRFGVQVTLLQRSARLIPDHEPELGEALEASLRAQGMTIHTQTHLLSIRQENGEKVVVAEVRGEQEKFRAEQVLMATGRTANSENMGLEEVGVALDRWGSVLVDEHLQTSVPGIYAVGDVTPLPKFVYTAAAAGGIATENALGISKRSLDLEGMPAVIFTDPAVAVAGLSERQATRQGYNVRTSILAMKHVPRALVAHESQGLIKLVADRSSDRLLGAHILAPEAGEMIETASLAIRFGLTLADLHNSLFPYLTYVEGLKLATLAFDKDPAMLSCCAG